MSKRQDEELRRLEEALLESEDTEDTEDLLEPDEAETEPWDDDMDYQVYNTDDTDVDLDEYSEDVYRERSGRGLSVLLTMLCMAALSVCILLLLKYLGVL